MANQVKYPVAYIYCNHVGYFGTSTTAQASPPASQVKVLQPVGLVMTRHLKTPESF